MLRYFSKSLKPNDIKVMKIDVVKEKTNVGKTEDRKGK